MIEKIISGGQTGADQGGLEAGKILGIPTGGWAPMNWMTENGPQKELLESLGLRNSMRPYSTRTGWNVREGDATVIFGDVREPGSRLTLLKPFNENTGALTEAFRSVIYNCTTSSAFIRPVLVTEILTSVLSPLLIFSDDNLASEYSNFPYVNPYPNGYIGSFFMYL